MWNVSAAFLDALTKTDQRLLVKAEVLQSGVTVRELEVVGGSINVDANSPMRRRCSLQLADIDLIPLGWGDLMVPTSEIKVQAGLRLDTGDELVPVGIFGVGNPQMEDSGDQVSFSVEGFDRSRKISRGLMTTVYVVASGTNYTTAIEAIIEARFPGQFTFSFSLVTDTTPRILLKPGDNVWERVQQMASAIGHVLYFDPAGTLVLKPIPDPETDPVVDYFVEGEKLTGIRRALSDEKCFSRVMVWGERPGGAPVFAEAKDLDPSSPTYINGPFGDVPFPYTSSLVTSTAQAQRVADGYLRSFKGLTERCEIKGVPNPALEAGDVVQAKRDRIKANANYVLDVFSFPLGLGELEGTARERRV